MPQLTNTVSACALRAGSAWFLGRDKLMYTFDNDVYIPICIINS